MHPDLESAVLAYVKDADAGRPLTADRARHALTLDFDEADQERVEYLSERCNEGLLTPVERAEYFRYVRVGQMLTLTHLRARKVLGLNVGRPVAASVP